jgi:hypothetical protein
MRRRLPTWLCGGMALMLASCDPAGVDVEPSPRLSVPPPPTREDAAPVQRAPQPVAPEELGLPLADDEGVKVVTHRTSAGERDQSGWCRAVSTDGGYSISLPNVFNDFTMTVVEEGGTTTTACVVAARTPERDVFSVVKFLNPPRSLRGKSYESLAEEFQQRGFTVKTRGVALDGVQGIEIQASSSRASGITRTFRTSTALYQISVEAFGPRGLEYIGDDARRFLESFAFPEVPLPSP